MFKPLLRTMPALTGNFTLACKLQSYNKISPIHFETGVTDAILMPLQNNLANTHFTISLLYDSYEYDVIRFYNRFSSMFYDDNYKFNKNVKSVLDLSSNTTNDIRNRNYEFGCKRNIMNSGYQYMFFAPIYITDVDNCPDEFVLHIEFTNNIYKNIRIKLFDDSDNDNTTNYLSVYLRRYIEKIDEKCIFCLPDSKQATYHGIDVKYGGFKFVKDNVFGKLYDTQLTLNDFDGVICDGYKRNKMIMKQIIPLSFIFNVSDILTRSERQTFLNKRIRISGWFEKNRIKYDFYDFDTNYKELLINNVNILNPNADDIQINNNLNYSLYESLADELKYDNTVSLTHNRWCLLPTIDNDNKYVVNSSLVFSDNSNKYYNVPDIIRYNNSYLHFNTYSDTVDISQSFIADNNDYSNIFTLTSHDIEHIKYDTKWYDVHNNKCIINGVLYDLSRIRKDIKIDKFNIFAYVNVIDVDKLRHKLCGCSITTGDTSIQINGTNIHNSYLNAFNHIDSYSRIFESYFTTNTLFGNEPIISIDDIQYIKNNLDEYDSSDNSYVMSYLIKNNNINNVGDIYLDMSHYYYRMNSFRKIDYQYSNIEDKNVLQPCIKNGGCDLYSMFVIDKRINTSSFINKFDIGNNRVLKKLSKICYVTINESNNLRSINDIISSNEHNNIYNDSSFITFSNNFVDTHQVIKWTYNYNKTVDDNTELTSLELFNKYYGDDKLSYLYHYIPYTTDHGFISHGHMEKNDTNVHYVYCDDWTLKNYIEFINRLVDTDDKLTYPNEDVILMYVGFINYDHYTKYGQRMYGDEYNDLYKLNVYINIISANNNTRIDDINVLYELEHYNNNILNEYNENDIKELINSNKLYHRCKVVRISNDFYDRIINIYNKYKLSSLTSCPSLILYSSNEDIIDRYDVDKVLVNNKKDIYISSQEILHPITKHIEYSNNSINETINILTSRNIRTDEDDNYITYNIYQLLNCNKVNVDDKETLNSILDYKNIEVYNRINVESIETDNTLHLFAKNSKQYAYYYIILNLFNNRYSFNINNNDSTLTFNISELNVNDIVHYMRNNIYDYIMNNMCNDVIINQNNVTLTIDKKFDPSLSTIIYTDKDKKTIDRYYNDIMPLLYETNNVNPNNLLYIDNELNVYRNNYDNVHSYTHPCSIDIYDTYHGVAYINKDNIIEYVDEYERKFFNDNLLYLLEPRIIIKFDKLYTYDDVLKIENDDYVLNNIFIPHIKEYNDNITNPDEFLFLFNRYNVKYESYPVKKNLSDTDKMYSLRITFTLV